MLKPAAAALVLALLACTGQPPAAGDAVPPTDRQHVPADRAAQAAANAAGSGLRSWPPSPPLVRAARQQVGKTMRYDPAYVRLGYPGGDVPLDRGVCTDVIVRALRTQGIDLQQAIHEDRAAHRAAYPAGSALDRNIDHRRVPNQMAWFERQGWALPVTGHARDNVPSRFLPGDIVAWRLSGRGLLHIGIVSDRFDQARVPLVLHNIGAGTREEPLLFEHAIIGHYRPRLHQGVPAVPVPGQAGAARS